MGSVISLLLKPLSAPRSAPQKSLRHSWYTYKLYRYTNAVNIKTIRVWRRRATEEMRRRMRWGVEKRLEFIEFRLFWEGGINRADIMERFGVSVPQASKDLSLYEEKALAILLTTEAESDISQLPPSSRHFLKPEADGYLTQLRHRVRTVSFPRKRPGFRICRKLMRCRFRTAAST